MITITLTEREAIKLRKLLEQGEHGPDLARVHYKIEHALKRPAVKQKWKNGPVSTKSIRFGGDD